MKGYVSYWEERLSFSPSPEDEHVFESVGPLALIIEDRKVYMLPDPDGNAMGVMRRGRNAGLGKKYQWKGMRQPWARWMRHETEVAVNPDGSYTFEIDADHLLPWPVLYRTGTFDYTAVAVREFRIRARSAYFAGNDRELKRVLRGIPSKFKRLIRTQVWTDIIEEVRKETPPWLTSNGTSCSTSRPSDAARMPP